MAKKKPSKPIPPVELSNPDDLVLIAKQEVLARVPISFVEIWRRMQEDPPRFPRAYTIGHKLCWRKNEIDQWLADVPLKRYPGNSDGVVVPNHFQHERRRAERKANKAGSKKTGRES
jgi:predicted DNA-binding transcriptional regulator AlpA